MMGVKLASFIITALLFSPIWPLGENPLPGYPYVIVNKSKNELAYIDNGRIEGIYRVATGKTAQLTPEGEFTILIKAKNPYYRKKDIVGGSPENPLGSRWIGFDAEETDGRTYGIHGNNDPDSVGKYISQGCIRMYEDDIQLLFENVPIGTKVLIVRSDKSFQELAKAHDAIQ